MRVPVQAGFANYKKSICVLTGQLLDPLLPGVDIKVVITRLQGGESGSPSPWFGLWVRFIQNCCRSVESINPFRIKPAEFRWFQDGIIAKTGGPSTDCAVTQTDYADYSTQPGSGSNYAFSTISTTNNPSNFSGPSSAAHQSCRNDQA